VLGISNYFKSQHVHLFAHHMLMIEGFLIVLLEYGIDRTEVRSGKK